MTTKALHPLVILIIVLAALFYFGGIAWTGIANLLNSSPQIPAIITNGVTGIGALLATYFGSVLGISIPSQATTVSSLTTRSQPAFNFFLLNTWNWRSVSPPARGGVGEVVLHPSTRLYQIVQIGACYAYFLSLVLAGAFWLILTLKGTMAVELLQNLVSMLCGVLIGVFSSVLNIRPATA